jgi:Mrp family chromosome partitioning ATPase
LSQDPGGINRLEKKAKQIIAITSGKGGVGKSSVTSMLAISLARQGFKTGILDADITGPSIARIFGTKEKPEIQGQDTLVPVPTASGVRILSMNLLIADEAAPVIWRGPLVNGAIRQLYGNAAWAEDFLLVDLPPGTSDANLTVYQSIPLDGVLIVTSPQDLVKMIVAKSISMAKQLRVPVVGLVENMASVACGHCGEVLHPFGPSRGVEAAQAAGIPFLGSLPIDPKLAEACDTGAIAGYSNPAFDEIAKKVVAAKAPK